MELGETPRAGALRELWEETRIQSVGAMRVLMVSQSFTLFGAYVPTKLAPRLDHEHDAFVWLPAHDPPRCLHPGLRGLWWGYPRNPRPHATVASFVANRGA